MRRLLRLIGTRYGLALCTALLVVGVVGAARLVGGPTRSEVIGPQSQPSIDISVGSQDDNALETTGSPTPSTRPGADTPDVVAGDFAVAWSRDGSGGSGSPSSNASSSSGGSADWLNGMRPYATNRLLDLLTGSDPTSVPVSADAVRASGGAHLQARAPTLVEATITTPAGTLRLRLVSADGRWRVDGVDWERA